MTRIHTNAQQFAVRGNPWSGEDAPPKPVKPENCLGEGAKGSAGVRMNRHGHLYAIMKGSCHASDNAGPDHRDNPDLDRHTLAGRGRTLDIKLAKERNHLSLGQSANKSDRPPSLVTLAAKLRAITRQHNVVVK